MENNITFLSVSPTPASVYLIGDVKNVINGTIPKNLEEQKFTAKGYRCGFEAASVGNVNSTGEAILVNEMCYVRPTSKQSQLDGKLQFSQKFLTPAFMLIANSSLPNYKFIFHSQSQFSTLNELYNKLYQMIEKPLVISALVEFNKLTDIALARPPVDGKNIFQNKQYYYPNEEQHCFDKQAVIVGAMANFDKITPKQKKDLEKLLYNNPFEPSSGLISHSHCLMLKDRVNHLEEVRPENAEKVSHLLLDDSIVKHCYADIFVIDDCISLY